MKKNILTEALSSPDQSHLYLEYRTSSRQDDLSPEILIMKTSKTTNFMLKWKTTEEE
ncbi:hypothetical protein ABID29_000398 [Streptococcus rupicaprae]|uniref:Uncharacterized protein n=1 Tax=Streptococcus rupicaprae TaxID=759619 RepID=A0ABV2FFE7_9STRE